ncbi:hypothetical protein NMG60_11024970 [Bertholletia excelsa]
MGSLHSGSGGTELRAAFDVLDANGDGKIGAADLRSFYSGFSGAGVGEAPAEDDIAAMISLADADKDGYVAYEEFERVLREREESSGGGRRSFPFLEEAFKMIDRDGDGRVGMEDLRSYLNMAGLEVGNEEEIGAMIRLGGGDEKEGVTYDGFLKILAF